MVEICYALFSQYHQSNIDVSPSHYNYQALLDVTRNKLLESYNITGVSTVMQRRNSYKPKMFLLKLKLVIQYYKISLSHRIVHQTHTLYI